MARWSKGANLRGRSSQSAPVHCSDRGRPDQSDEQSRQMDLFRASSGRPCLLGVARIGYEPNPAWLAPVAQRSLDEQLDEASAPEIGHQVRGSTSSALIVPEFPARPDYKPR